MSEPVYIAHILTVDSWAPLAKSGVSYQVVV